MKNFKFLLLFLSLLFLYSCSKEEPLSISPNADNTASVRDEKMNEESMLNDTTDWELTFLFDLMAEEMDGEMILNFINEFGYPHANKGFRKRGENFNITSIPTIKAGSITGIIKVMVKPNGVDAIYFFPIKEIETAISKEYLETEDYHLYRGAVQSLILCANGMNATLDSKYLDWLISNNDRAGERIDLNCFTIYGDCYYPQFAAIDPVAFQLNGSEIWCNYVSTECYISQAYVGGGFNNFTPNIDNPSDPTGPNNGGGSSSTPDINEDFYAEKAAFLEKWLEDNDVDNELFDELYLCVYHLYVEGYGLVEPTGIAPGCVEEVLVAERAEAMISDFNLSISIEDLLEIIGEDCPVNTQGAFENCAWGALLINDGVDLNDISEISEQQAVVLVNSLNPICPGMFEFNHTNETNNVNTAGLSNINVGLNINGVTRFFSFDNLYFQSPDLNTCSETLSQKAADAINQSINSAAARIGAGNLYTAFDPFGNLLSLEDRIKLTVYGEIQRNFINEANECAPANSGYDVRVKLIGDGDVWELTQYENAVFTDFVQDFNNTCP